MAIVSLLARSVESAVGVLFSVACIVSLFVSKVSRKRLPLPS